MNDLLIWVMLGSLAMWVMFQVARKVKESRGVIIGKDDPRSPVEGHSAYVVPPIATPEDIAREVKIAWEIVTQFLPADAPESVKATLFHKLLLHFELHPSRGEARDRTTSS